MQALFLSLECMTEYTIFRLHIVALILELSILIPTNPPLSHTRISLLQPSSWI